MAKWGIVQSGSEDDPCCCGAEPCCEYYPWNNSGVIYSNDDLPSAVKYKGETLTRSGSTFTGATYEIVSGVTAWEVRKLPADVLFNQSALTSCSVKDVFATSYAANFYFFGDLETTVVREANECRWKSIFNYHDDPNVQVTVTVGYDSINYKWEYFLNIFDLIYEIGFDQTGVKFADQGTPIGDYGQFPDETDFTLS